MTTFKRAIIKGTLSTKTPFHIGTGKEDIEDKIQFNQLCLDYKGKPYIPASSLRGYLRNLISLHASQNETALFGLARQKKEAPETGNTGLLRVYDCRWNSGENNSQLISQTSIEPVSATAKHHQLSTHATIPPNSQFLLHLELDNASEDFVRLILQALQTFNDSGQGKLGKGKSTGQGIMLWEPDKVEVLTEKRLKDWLNKGAKKTHKYKKKASTEQQPQQPLANYFESKTFLVEAFTPPFKKLEIKLKANSPLLINSVQTQKDKKTEQEPDLIYSQRDHHAIIQGSTLKGWTRARARRILLTQPNTTEQTVDQLIAELFGNTLQQGYLVFNDTTVPVTSNDQHLQTFTAIDRFTGGVKEGALYNVEAIWPETDFTGSLGCNKPLHNWMKLLLLYILKDSMEGDLVLGWGKSKGYGRLQLNQIEYQQQKYQNWNSLYQALSQTELRQWNTDLQQKLQGDK